MNEDSQRSASARDRLLDAGEALFAEKGYFGASMREIAVAAASTLGNITYHFSSKDVLFRAVLVRRVPELRAALEASLARAEGRGLQAVLDAYAEVWFERLSSPQIGWRRYVRLASMSTMQSLGDEVFEPTWTSLSPVLDRYNAALAVAAPQLDARTIEHSFYAFRRSVAAICADMRRPVDDFHPEELGRLVAQVTALGLIALAKTRD